MSSSSLVCRGAAALVVLVAGAGQAQPEQWSSAAPVGDFRSDGGSGVLFLEVAMSGAAKLWLSGDVADGGAGVAWTVIDPNLDGGMVGGPTAVAGLCDIDGDGLLDAVALVPGASGVAHGVWVYWGDGRPAIGAPAPLGLSLSGGLACVPNFLGDDRTWVLVGSSETGGVVGYTYDGTKLEVVASIAVGSAGCGASLAGMHLPGVGGLVAVGCPPPFPTGIGPTAVRALRVTGSADGVTSADTPQGAGLSFGSSLDFVGDVDGDGLPDLLVADTTNIGSTTVYGYSVTPTGSFEPWTNSDAALAPITARILRAGDLNGDGYADALLHSAGAHTVVAVLGGSTVLLRTIAVSDACSFASWMPDVDGDGFADFACVTPGIPPQLDVIRGSARGPGAGQGMPTGFTAPIASIAAGIDVDGDGVSDVVVGMPGAGLVGLMQPNTTGSVLTSVEHDAESFGSVIAPAGDFNGDGYGDVLVSAPDSDTGAVFILYGSSSGLTEAVPLPMPVQLQGRSPRAFGWSVAGVGDVDGDGYDDVVVGAPALYDSDPTQPRAWLYRGGLTETAPVPVGAEMPLPNGTMVGRAGDLNGDGYADIIVGLARVAEVGGFLEVYGSDEAAGGLTQLFNETVEAGQLSLGGPGDIDGDGLPDVAFWRDDTGAAYIRGASRPNSLTAQPLLGVGPVPRALTVVGDVDGDGWADLASFDDDASGKVDVRLRGKGGPVSRLADCGLGTDQRLLAAGGDLDGDGFQDFVSSRVGEQTLCVHYGGDELRGRPWNLRQAFGGVSRGRGFRAPAGAPVSLRGIPLDEVAGLETPIIEVELRPLGERFTGVVTHASQAITGTVPISGLQPGRYRWRARVRSGAFTSRWRRIAGPDDGTADFSVGLDGHVVDDGGVVIEPQPDAGTVDGGGTSDGGTSDGGAAADSGVTSDGGEPGDAGPGAPRGALDFRARACGCSGAPGGLVVIALVLLGWRRRLSRRA